MAVDFLKGLHFNSRFRISISTVSYLNSSLTGFYLCSEKKIILESGDALVFGGESRLVYHGTRCVQPGTRPPGLHMVPGRLNFTFRQCNAPRSGGADGNMTSTSHPVNYPTS
jgi:hypothetical protein